MAIFQKSTLNSAAIVSTIKIFFANFKRLLMTTGHRNRYKTHRDGLRDVRSLCAF